MRPGKLHLTGAAAIIVFSLVLSGCSSKPTAGDVMAKVNGKKILRSEVDKYYSNQTAGSPQQPSGEQADTLRLNILKSLIDNEILTQRAEKDGLLATDDEVQRKLNEEKAGFTEEEYQKRLADRHMSVDDEKQLLRRQIILDKVLNKEVTSKIEIKDSDITAYYNEHKAEFNLIEPQYRMAHIMVTSSPEPQPRNPDNHKAQNDAEAKRKIHELYNRLESGDKFAEVAMNYSEDPETAPNGGELGTIPESGLKSTDAATRDAVLKLKPGHYSDIITVVDPATKKLVGYRIIMLIDKMAAGQRDLNDPRVQEFIRGRLRDGRSQLLWAAFLEVLRNQAKVENYYAELILKGSGNAAK